MMDASIIHHGDPSYYSTVCLSFLNMESCIQTMSCIRNTKDCSASQAESNRKCLCGSRVCEEARSVALELLDSSHGWSLNNGLTVIKHSDKNNPTDKVEALRQSCAHHLKLDPTRKGKDVYHIASIHWPSELISKFPYRSTPFNDIAQARDIDKLANYQKRFADDRNKFANLLKDKIKNKKLKNKYAQAPVHPVRDVLDYLNSIKRSRNKRKRTDSADYSAISGPTDLIAPKKMKTEPMNTGPMNTKSTKIE